MPYSYELQSPAFNFDAQLIRLGDYLVAINTAGTSATLRLYDTSSGAMVLVDTTTVVPTFRTLTEQLAVIDDTRFVVAWQDDPTGAGTETIKAQVFDITSGAFTSGAAVTIDSAVDFRDLHICVWDNGGQVTFFYDRTDHTAIYLAIAAIAGSALTVTTTRTTIATGVNRYMLAAATVDAATVMVLISLGLFSTTTPEARGYASATLRNTITPADWDLDEGHNADILAANVRDGVAAIVTDNQDFAGTAAEAYLRPVVMSGANIAFGARYTARAVAKPASSDVYVHGWSPVPVPGGNVGWIASYENFVDEIFEANIDVYAITDAGVVSTVSQETVPASVGTQVVTPMLVAFMAATSGYFGADIYDETLTEVEAWWKFVGGGPNPKRGTAASLARVSAELSRPGAGPHAVIGGSVISLGPFTATPGAAGDARGTGASFQRATANVGPRRQRRRDT